jgi:hypothetical protein
VRSLPSLICGGKEISWRAAQSRRTLKMYDKSGSVAGANKILRVELRLAGAKLREKLDDKAELNFSELYQIFRSEVVKLSPITLPEPRKHSLPEVAATLPVEAQTAFLLAYWQGRTSRAVRGFQRAISTARLNSLQWNWRDVLSVETPAPPAQASPLPAADHVIPTGVVHLLDAKVGSDSRRDTTGCLLRYS